MIRVRLTHEPISHVELTDSVLDPGCGATVTFLGTVRDRTGDTITTSLDYEAYPEMARLELERLANEARTRWPIARIAIEHRLGHLNVGEASIAISLSSPHRVDAFAAVAWLMDRIKESVPIWKRETDGEGRTGWVHPGVQNV